MPERRDYDENYHFSGSKSGSEVHSVHGSATKEINCKYYIDLGQFIEKMKEEGDNEIKKFVDSVILLLQTFDNYDIEEVPENKQENVNISALERFRNLLD